MSYKSMGHKSISVDVYFDEFDDEDLIEELEGRGYTVDKEEDNYLQEVIDWYKRGDVKEALIQLERVEPQLFGISEKVK
jgi:broad-specificity NMP kinase